MLSDMELTDEPVSVLDLATQVGKRKQTIFKILARLKIQTTKQRSSDSRGQLIAYVSAEDAQRVIELLKTDVPGAALGTIAATDNEIGVFYLLALEPDHDPGRFKLGFAVHLPERLQKHRCSAPLLKVVRSWPCKRLWEKTAIDAVTVGCERLHTEVFRTDSISAVVERGDRFFAVMPKV